MFKILDILFPRYCLGCSREGKYICPECQTFLGEASLICPVCNKSSFTGEKHSNCFTKYSLDGLTSVWEYEGIIKQLINEAKYKGINHALSEAAAKAFEAILKDEIRFKPFFQFLSLSDIYINYVPMFEKKEKQRGFNQAHLIAQEIGKIIEKPVLNLLEKTKDTVSQTDLSREERIANVRNSFSLRKPVFSANFSVLLVDDIWTTGATMRECCKILKKSGIEKVWGFTLARTI